MPEQPQPREMKIKYDPSCESYLLDVLRRIGCVNSLEIKYLDTRQPAIAKLDLDGYNPDIVTWLKDESSRKMQPVITAENFRQFAQRQTDSPREGESIANALLRRYPPSYEVPQNYLFYNQTTGHPIGVLANHLENLYLQIQTSPQFFPNIGEDRARLIGLMVDELYLAP